MSLCNLDPHQSSGRSESANDGCDLFIDGRPEPDQPDSTGGADGRQHTVRGRAGVLADHAEA